MNTITIEEARSNVARGAAYLDQQRPGWFQRIDIGTLTLHDPCGCIVGQLCGTGHEFVDGMRSLSIPFDNHGSFDAKGYGLALENLTGVTHDDPRADYVILQDAWIEAIAARRFPLKDTDRPTAATPTNAVAESVGVPVAVSSRR